MATPHIAGLAALLLDARPQATMNEIEAAILASCENPAGVCSKRIGAGIPNGEKALDEILTAVN